MIDLLTKRIIYEGSCVGCQYEKPWDFEAFKELISEDVDPLSRVPLVIKTQPAKGDPDSLAIYWDDLHAGYIPKDDKDGYLDFEELVYAYIEEVMSKNYEPAKTLEMEDVCEFYLATRGEPDTMSYRPCVKLSMQGEVLWFNFNVEVQMTAPREFFRSFGLCK